LLRKLEETKSLWTLFNKDYEGDIKRAGDTVNILTLDDVAVRSYPASADITYDPITSTTQTLVADQEDYWGVELEDIDRLQARVLSNPDSSIIERAASAINLSLNSFVTTTLQAAVSTAAPDHSDDAGAAIDLDNFKDQKLKLDLTSTPAEGRICLIHPENERQVLDIPQVINADQFGGGNRPLVDGFIGRLEGFDLISTLSIANVAGPKKPVLFTYKGAMTVATQMAPTVEALRGQTRFKDMLRALWVYGAKVTRPNSVTEVQVTTV